MRVRLFVATILFAGRLFAHCDTLNGPVVAAARLALEKGDVTPVLKWIPAAAEVEVRQAFQQAVLVRSKTDDARQLADRWFFETVVRLHRAGEGEPFTGLKATPPDALIQDADTAVEKGSVDELAALISRHIAAQVREKFQRVIETRKTSEQSVDAGRRYVAAYVDFVHYLEQIHGTGGGHEQHSH